MKDNISISWAICVHNEHKELERLLDQLMDCISIEDEIVIQGDDPKVTIEVAELIADYMLRKDPSNRIKYIAGNLNFDFAAFKNNLLRSCVGDYIFLMDADEYLAEPLVANVKDILLENEEIEAYFVPRINTVSGITDEYIKQNRWMKTEIDGLDVINFPDPQMRIFKNHIGIHYVGKVHEQVIGYRSSAMLPCDTFDWCLFHPKTFDRQKKQNEFYNTLNA